MIRNFFINKLMWYAATVFSLIISSATLLNIGIYSKVVTQEVMPGIVSQDLVTMIISVFILGLLICMKESSYKGQMILFSFMIYLFYAYGIYVIERFYNIFYLAYMFIFAVSFYSIIYSFVSINKEAIQVLKVSNFIKRISAIFLMTIPIMFYSLWISRLIPLVNNGTKIEFFYSVFILDLCFIMPFFVIISIISLRNKSLGTILTPCGLMFGSVLLLSVGIGEILKLYFHAPLDFGGICFYLGLAVVFGVLSLVNFIKLI